ncbi:TadE family protein [Curtobacterium sp. MCPF17_052]|uniref:TadE family protein n=1 Tax=Curtobacterium sp. MCPF17_052 TaxID=2175655 RepID=UPI0024DFECBB|nr:TadE family protein [Curtobacterium sp. MCPF17_052]WIB13070.1 pilus assembly protein [Curtobacterium sp. MCPF17_052]
MQGERRVSHDRDEHQDHRRNQHQDDGRDRGSVTVEFALALPVFAVVLAAAIAGVMAVDGQGRLQTAAAVAARALARGDDPAARQALERADAGTVRVERAGGPGLRPCRTTGRHGAVLGCRAAGERLRRGRGRHR